MRLRFDGICIGLIGLPERIQENNVNMGTRVKGLACSWITD